ncbi:MAG TPA: hypothetical protein VJ901_16305 [Thermoanaerobaculia bacterium]|nr:hypothetical protein [Thermoanaerobaculia bacterium]
MCLFVVPAAWACRVDDPAFTSNYRWNDLEGNLADYARIHMDAESPSCALKADYALTDKVRNTIDANSSEFQGWLRGAHVSLIFAAAQRIGANGFATKELDAQLRRLETNYAFVKDAGCDNINGTNNCLDDYSQAAVGYAWIAAYKYRRGDSDASVSTFRSAAINQIDNFFSNVCIHSSTGNPTVLCNGSVSGLQAGTDETITFNHGQQMPSYGFGLMTSLASAAMGLKASGYAYSFSYPNHWTIASGLMKEMQLHVDSSNAFKNDCYAISRDGAGVYSFDPSRPCGGPDGYKPEMYALNAFYSQKLGGIPQSGVPGVYQANYFNSSLFDTSSTSMQFFGMARYVVYGKHGYSWWVTTPEWMPKDLYNPKGYLEAVSSTGLAQGWTCDQDAPSKSNVVDLYATNTKVTNIVRADSGSESAIASECNGGSYHRFWIQLPSWTKGQTITAYGLDYTWFGFTQLPCLQPGGCKW